jgi:recombination protein RecT
MEPTTQAEKPQTAISLFKANSVQERFNKLLGAKSQGFISSVLQTVQSSSLLQRADPLTVLNAAATAAALDLPINQSLGFAWIVPYKGQAQFQIGWRGFVQLALRTGQYKSLNVTEVYASQFVSFNRLTEELDADFSKDGTGAVVGYVAYFKLLNGFEKMEYWSRDRVVVHAKKYSKSYSSAGSVWADPSTFDAMAKKTVLKSTLSKWGIMSIEMSTAVIADQSVVTDEGSYSYVDNKEETLTQVEANEMEELARAKRFLDKCTSLEEVELLESSIPDITTAVAAAIEGARERVTNGINTK